MTPERINPALRDWLLGRNREMVFRCGGWYTDSLDSMALIEQAMTREELLAYYVYISNRVKNTPYESNGGAFGAGVEIMTAPASLRAEAAYVTLNTSI